jgi:hypothetical protein
MSTRFELQGEVEALMIPALSSRCKSSSMNLSCWGDLRYGRDRIGAAPGVSMTYGLKLQPGRIGLLKLQRDGGIRKEF